MLCYSFFLAAVQSARVTASHAPRQAFSAPMKINFLNFCRYLDFPLLERCRYVAIWSANLDEFFAARVQSFFPDPISRKQASMFTPSASKKAFFPCFMIANPVLVGLSPEYAEILNATQQVKENCY